MTHDESKPSASHALRWLVVFMVLCLLTATSFMLANSVWMKTDPLAAQLAMIAISAIKAWVVVMFFMHFWWERNWKFLVTIPAILMAIILTMALIPDVGQRVEHYSTSRGRLAPPVIIPEEKVRRQ